MTHLPLRLSVPSVSHADKDTDAPPLAVASGLTPPVTPTLLEGRSPASSQPVVDSLAPLPYGDDLHFHHDPKGRPLEYGRGVWSVVYKASRVSAPSSPFITPPSSPAPGNRLVAVKAPVRRDAHAVLDAEAQTLTRITRSPGCEQHVVPFHGFIADTHSLVLAAVPLSLATYIEDKAAVAHQQLSTRTMFDPVQGMRQWQHLASNLIAGLHWLHAVPHVVHGDIKPHNLLLRPRAVAPRAPAADGDDDFPFDALFADFSSAHDLAGDSLSAVKGTPSTTALTALTPPFAAPELLSVASLTSPHVAPTPASDVFSLAVTLLAAATGDLLLYPGASSMQRLAMAREGHRVIEFARSGSSGSRVPRNGLVERSLVPAIARDPAQRIRPRDWVELVDSVAV
ncbi:kinase-like domain-containing protein [Aspergillus ambiguus]|uniref:protein kinase domain-containing protein n=1 Tax=Aspergillus ambiguus TaxID=176160 RepID=UPI003CCC9B7D